MSNKPLQSLSDRKHVGGGYLPAPLKPAQLTIPEIQSLGSFFKELIDSSDLKKWVVVAGVGAGLEILHILWLAARFLLKF